MSHVGPIIFADQDAREQLRSEGYVVTFRETERTTGQTWWRKSRTGEKQGDCRVDLLQTVDAANQDALAPYYVVAGFDSVEDWQDAIEEQCGALPEGYLYGVGRQVTAGGTE